MKVKVLIGKLRSRDWNIVKFMLLKIIGVNVVMVLDLV